jgi:hypothetical protein
MTRPRFSLRGLLLLTALVAAFCYWHDRPRRVANKFAALLEGANFEAANAMIFLGEHRMTAAFHASAYEVQRSEQSLRDWLSGRCPIVVRDKRLSSPAHPAPILHTAEASARRIEMTGANFGLRFGK